jgi:hypothetical protein
MATLDLLVGATAADRRPLGGFSLFLSFGWRELAMARRRHARANLAGARPNAHVDVCLPRRLRTWAAALR